MDKKKEFASRLNLLLEEIEKAKPQVDPGKVDYLSSLAARIEAIRNAVNSGALPASGGGTLGIMRAISEYDTLSDIDPLYDAAADVDLYYRRECTEW